MLTRSHLGPDFAASTPTVTLESARRPAIASNDAIDLKEATKEFQRSLIERALAVCDGNWSAAARSLGMHRSNFHHLAVRLGLK